MSQISATQRRHSVITQRNKPNDLMLMLICSEELACSPGVLVRCLLQSKDMHWENRMDGWMDGLQQNRATGENFMCVVKTTAVTHRKTSKVTGILHHV